MTSGAPEAVDAEKGSPAAKNGVASSGDSSRSGRPKGGGGHGLGGESDCEVNNDDSESSGLITGLTPTGRT